MDGRVALVTGAGRGIGRATALLLARRGARVMAVSRTPETLDGLEAEGVAATLTIDLATRDACEQAVEETRRRLGPIELLVNNAGVGSTFSDAIFTQPLGDWQTTMAVNLDAPFHLTQLASADMRARGYGRIVMVSSTSGLDGSPDDVAYTSSKHGLIGLTRAVAQDVGSFGGTCNAVCPGWVYTPMADRSAARTAQRTGTSVDDVWHERDAIYRRGKALQPEEIAEVVAFLCSAASSGVNGEAIRVAAGGSA
jgi:NAD(P)-dependent dehydrogenase (short-subunit alcohol dehydrogenase family)